MRSEKLQVNQIVEFLNQVYNKLELMNELDFWYADVDSRNVEGDL